MNNFWNKLKSWFKPKPSRKLKPTKKLTSKSPTPYQPINHKHYRQLIGKIAKRAIATQRARQQKEELLMTNLTICHPFSFLAKQPQKPAHNSCNLAWIDDSFHLHGHNYFIYTCHTCQRKQVKKGQQPKEYSNWGGRHE